MNAKLMFLALLILIKLRSANLICNGDLESYFLYPTLLQTEKLSYLKPSQSCWYTKSGSDW